MSQANLFNTVHGQHCFHAVQCQIRLLQQIGGIGQFEQFSQMNHRTGALLPAHHREMFLVAIEPGHEDHTRLIKACWRFENMARQRHGGPQDSVKLF